ncbi:MAG: lysophospholipase [Nocardioides sp.]|nr:lysophospholipase [Nocardioides sp.]
MVQAHDWEYAGHAGRIAARTWPNPEATHTILLCPGYGEHIGRYPHVADHLVAHGAEVHGIDHAGHGRSDGERVLITDFEQVVDDLHALAQHENVRRDLPVVLLGHSMGGMIAARYAQRYADQLAGLVLSGPVLGHWQPASDLAGLDQMPDEPIDPSTLSRDPAVGDAYQADPLVWHGRFRKETVTALLRCLDTITEAGALGDLPTVWLHGQDDPLVPVEGTQQGIGTLRGSDFAEKLYPGARHEILNETNRGEVLTDVDRFVAEVVRSPR